MQRFTQLDLPTRRARKAMGTDMLSRRRRRREGKRESKKKKISIGAAGGCGSKEGGS
jgi:hypothetical protein